MRFVRRLLAACAVVAIGGCTQILGDDFKIDPCTVAQNRAIQCNFTLHCEDFNNCQLDCFEDAACVGIGLAAQGNFDTPFGRCVVACQ